MIMLICISVKMLLTAEGKAYDFAAVTKKSKIAVESTEA